MPQDFPSFTEIMVEWKEKANKREDCLRIISQQKFEVEQIEKRLKELTERLNSMVGPNVPTKVTVLENQVASFTLGNLSPTFIEISK